MFMRRIWPMKQLFGIPALIVPTLCCMVLSLSVYFSPSCFHSYFQWLLRLLDRLRNPIISIITTVHKVGTNGFCRSKGQEVCWKIFSFTLLIPSWQHRAGFKEIFIIGAVLIQPGVSWAGKNEGTIFYNLIPESPFRVEGVIKIVNTVRFPKAQLGLSFGI